MSDLLFKELYKKSLRFLGIRLRSEKEMRDKIAEWIKKDTWAYGKDSDSSDPEIGTISVSDRIIDQLKRDRFLDDQRFAEEWVSSRVRNKPRGEVLLRMELAHKGIDRFVIDEVLEQVLRNQSADESDQNTLRTMAIKVGTKYIRRFEGEDDRAFKFKMSQVLARKGFDNAVIKSVVDELLATRYNTRD